MASFTAAVRADENLETTGPPLSALVDPATHAFFLDVDGTLLEIAPHPDAVKIPEGLAGTLETLARLAGGALALVSGRTVERLDALFAPVVLPVAGSHGAELRLAPGAPVERAGDLDRPLVATLHQVAARFAGVFTEDKGPAFAVHYRARPELKPELLQALGELLKGRPDLTLLAGHFVFEIKPAGQDKGTAIRAFMSRPPFAGRTPLFIGDDVTDEDGFHAVSQAGGLAVAVGAPRAGAHEVMSGPAAVRAFLTHLAAAPRQRRR